MLKSDPAMDPYPELLAKQGN